MREVSRWRWIAPALAVALGLLALGAVLVDLVGPTVLHQAEPLKWLYSGAAVFVGALLATALVPHAAGEAFASDGPLANDTIELGSSVLLVCIAIAVLKYRLYARWVQHAVDRRFNRTRYDAEAVVASFTARLRQTVDLGTMQAELSSTVHRAFEPAHVSIWSADDTGTR